MNLLFSNVCFFVPGSLRKYLQDLRFSSSRYGTPRLKVVISSTMCITHLTDKLARLSSCNMTTNLEIMYTMQFTLVQITALELHVAPSHPMCMDNWTFLEAPLLRAPLCGANKY